VGVIIARAVTLHAGGEDSGRVVGKQEVIRAADRQAIVSIDDKSRLHSLTRIVTGTARLKSAMLTRCSRLKKATERKEVRLGQMPTCSSNLLPSNSPQQAAAKDRAGKD
jgi:small ligand-binding sensory domain FIST